jgi:predicted membrane protein
MHMHCRTEHRDRRGGGLFFGGALVIFGVGYLLGHLDMLGDLRPWQVWPAIPIWAGLLRLVDARRSGERLWGFILIIFGVAFGAHYLGCLPFDWRIIWPILLIIAGLAVLFGAFCRRRMRFHAATTDAPLLDVQATLSGREDRVDAQDFRGGRIRCRLGGYKLDLRRAEIEGEEAVLDVDIVMGGVEIFIPQHWGVRAEVSPIMGGLEDKTRPNGVALPTKRLVVRGTIVMSGVEIKN